MMNVRVLYTHLYAYEWSSSSSSSSPRPERTFNSRGETPETTPAIRHGVTFTTPDKLNIFCANLSVVPSIHTHTHIRISKIYNVFAHTTTAVKAIQLNRPQRKARAKMNLKCGRIIESQDKRT